MHKKTSFSIRTKLVLLTASLIFLVGTAISWFATQTLRNQLYAMFEEDVQQLMDSSVRTLVDPLYLLDANQIREEIKRLKSNTDITRVYVLDKEGRLLSDGEENPQNWMKIPDVPDIKTLIEKKVENHLTFRGYIHDGHPIFGQQGELLGYLYVEYSAAHLEKNIAETLQHSLILTLCCALAGAAIAWLIAWRITSPLPKILKAVHEIGQGNFDPQLPSENQDEIGQLGLSIKQMATNLKNNAVSINILNHEVKERERLLQDLSEQKFALDQHAIVTITDVRGVITYVNDKFCEISGYSREELIGQNHRIVNSGTHDKAFFSNMYRTIAQGNVWQGDICNRAKNGCLYWVASTLVPFKNEQGKPKSYIAIRRDITELKRVEQLKSEFVSTVSHELRTPLTAINGSLSLILGGVLGVLPDKQAQLLTLAHNNCKRLNFLINDLLDIEKLAAGKMDLQMQVQPLLTIVKQAITNTQNIGATRQVAIQLLTPDQDCNVQVDLQRLIQVITNLLSNAIKYSPDEQHVDVSIEAESTWVRVSVRDYGCGVPLEFHNKIFQKFSQADSSDTRKVGGTGLGLAICKALIEQMGGTIDFDRKLATGACFYFKLPIQPPTI